MFFFYLRGSKKNILKKNTKKDKPVIKGRKEIANKRMGLVFSKIKYELHDTKIIFPKTCSLCKFLRCS